MNTESESHRELELIGPFRARSNGRTQVMPHSVARLLALVAVVGPMARVHVGEQLWPDADQARASANLRSTLVRLNAIDDQFLEVNGEVLTLAEKVSVDVDAVLTWVHATIYGAATQAAISAPPASIGREILQGWEEPWLTDPRERIRLLQTQALETAAERLISSGRPAEALPYALAAVQAQPWSESANRLIIEIHARRGDPSNALRRFQRFRAALERELGVQPGPEMLASIRQLYPFGNFHGGTPARPANPQTKTRRDS